MSGGIDNVSRRAALLAGGGELGERMRAVDWSQTPLGPIEHWPQSLRTCVRIVLTSRQPMFVWWGDQLINLYNDAYISILGGKHPWALGRPAAEVWREIWDDVGPRAAKAMSTDEGTFDEALLLVMERNGYREETYYTFSHSPVPGDAGGPGGILCANSSDTQRIFGERQQALLREVAARTTNARTVDDACRLALEAFETNRKDFPFAMLYLLERDTARILCTAGIDPTHPAVVAEATRATSSPWPLAEVLATNALATRPIARADLPTGPWPEPTTEAIGIPVRGADQSLVAVLVVGRNPFRLLDADYRRFCDLLSIQIGNAITSARTFEEERRRAEVLAELDRAKTTFFSNISHEFRTPLTLMLGPTEDAIASGGSLSGDTLGAVHRNELRLLKLVNALLDFSRIEAGRMQARFAPTALDRLTSELASSFRAAIEAAGLRFTVDCAPLAEPAYVDPRLWETIVLNLVSNAFKFTFQGGIDVSLHERDHELELRVHDTGVGIPEAEMPRLFERFHRIETSRARTHEGTGIGLAMVQELTRLHGGTIEATSEVTSEATSEVGSGTEFCVRIPRGRAHLPAAQVADEAATFQNATRGAFVAEAQRWEAHPEVSMAAGGPPERVLGATADDVPTDLAGAHILVADDNADMRDYLRRLLGERWNVTTAPDGVRAVEVARQLRPDLVLTDVMMPNLDGFGVVRALRADAALSAIPVVMLSARAGEESRVEGLEASADDYLIKPFSPRELIARVSNMLQLAQLRRKVELERDRLASFIHQAPVGIVLWEGEDLRCGVANQAYQRLIGRPLPNGMPLREIFPEADGTETLRRVQRVFRDGQPVDVSEHPVTLRRADGTFHEGFYDRSYRPLQDGNGATVGVIEVLVEVTEQVRARKAAEHSRAEAVVANRAKDEFLAMLGHELRNPLAPILTALELMRLRGGDLLARERAVIERQTLHLTSLVEDLLDVSRIARGKVELRREQLRLADVIAKAVETAAPLFEQQRHELSTQVPRELVLGGDPARLTQVFANLLTNAAKYTDPGGRVTIAAERDGDAVVVRVSDTGRGISAEMLPRVFDLFVQERQNLGRSLGGLGLGLAIVRNLVQLHGGRVGASSPGPGRGSTFTVWLPLATDPALEAAPSQPSSIRGRQAEAPSLSVLVVDDNLDAAALLADLLSSRGYQTNVAHDAPAVLSLAPEDVPDVVLVDIGLPAMDGYELARRLRDQPAWRGAKLIAVTGYGQPLDRERSKQAGFDQHLVKPVDLATLERCLPGRRARSTNATASRRRAGAARPARGAGTGTGGRAGSRRGVRARAR